MYLSRFFAAFFCLAVVTATDLAIQWDETLEIHDIDVEYSDRLLFRWVDPDATIYKLPSKKDFNNCNFKDAEKLSTHNNEYLFAPGKPLIGETVYFADGFGKRCKVGDVKIAIHISGCPSNYRPDEDLKGCCSAYFDFECREYCALDFCDEFGWNFVWLDFEFHPYTCCPYSNGCPPGFFPAQGGTAGCCIREANSICDIDCAQANCENHNGWKWIKLDFDNEPFTCCQSGVQHNVLHPYAYERWFCFMLSVAMTLLNWN